jgi:hypothetical protein
MVVAGYRQQIDKPMVFVDWKDDGQFTERNRGRYVLTSNGPPWTVRLVVSKNWNGLRKKRHAQKKSRPKAAFRSPVAVRLSDVQGYLVVATVCHDADASKAKYHHRPSRGFGDASNALVKERLTVCCT